MARNVPKRMGKSEARAKFLPLVQALAQGGGPVEITDRGKVEAVLLSNEEYQWLLVRGKTQPALTKSLVGAMVLEEDLEAADQEISSLFEKSMGSGGEIV